MYFRASSIASYLLQCYIWTFQGLLSLHWGGSYILTRPSLCFPSLIFVSLFYFSCGWRGKWGRGCACRKRVCTSCGFHVILLQMFTFTYTSYLRSRVTQMQDVISVIYPDTKAEYERCCVSLFYDVDYQLIILWRSIYTSPPLFWAVWHSSI